MIINPGTGAASLNGVKIFSTVIPKGRMRGDVDGDGKITLADADTITSYIAGRISLDEIQKWCASVIIDNTISISDASQISNYVNGKSEIPHEDYYGNWTYVHAGTSHWEASIPISGLTSSMSAIIFVSDSWKKDMFANAEILDGKVRIQSICPNITDVPISVVYGPGDGRAFLQKEKVITPDNIGAANRPIISYVQLKQDAWDADKKQIVSVNGVKGDEELQNIHIHAFNASSAEYLRCGISVVDQGNGLMQFYAENVPEKTLYLRAPLPST